MSRNTFLPFVCVAFSVLAPAAAAVTVDGVVAVVDKEVILHSDLVQQVGPYLADLRTQVANEQELSQKADDLMAQALEQAIQDKLLLREALLAGVEIQTQDIERRLEEIRKLYPTNEEFLKDMQNSGENMDDLRERLRKQLLARVYANRKIIDFEKEIVVTESDVAQYFQDHQADYSHPERIQVRQIFLPAGTSESERETVKARIEELKGELDKGGDFGELAKAYSKAPGAESGGLIGWQDRGDLVDALDGVAFTLPEGGMSGVVESPGGFHILKVDKKEAAGQSSLDDVRKEIEPLLRKQGAADKFSRWIEDMRKKSKVQVFL
jgi:peptidyl-prolyl cis-trans isomerase SurA